MARFTITRHATEQAVAKGFGRAEIFEACHGPEKVTNVTKYPGQKRFIRGRIAVVAAPLDDEGAVWRIVTVYLDGVLTPPRPDQMSTPEGARYAQRYAAGLGRG